MYRGILKFAGFSLVALLLAGLFLSAVMRWREKANRLRCVDNLRRVGWFAMWSYTTPPRYFPAGPTTPSGPSNSISMRNSTPIACSRPARSPTLI